jgi:PAS domain S-box-containing protein
MNASQSADQINSMKGMQRGSRLAVVPWLLLAFTLALTFLLWSNARHEALHARKAEFEFRIKDVAGRLHHRVQDYEHLLYGVRAFFLNQHQVEHREFHGYVAALNLQQRFQNVQAVDYVSLVSRAQKKIHERTVRRDGLAGYTIRPPGERGEYAPSSYVEPLNKSNLSRLGFDNLTDPERKAALEKSRDIGHAVITGMLQTGSKGDAGSKPLVQMFLPLYQPGLTSNTQAARRSHLTGWLGASFYVSDMMSGVLGAEKNDLDVEIYDGAKPSEQQLIYDSDNHASRKLKHLYQTSMLMPVAGRNWLFTAHSLPGFEAGVDMTKPAFVAVAGTLTSILLAMLAWLLLRDRTRTAQLAAGLNDELIERKKFEEALRESEENYRELFEFANEFITTTTLDGNVTSVNNLMLETLGYSQQEMQGMNLSGFMTPESLIKARGMTAKKLAGESKITRYELDLRAKDGRVVPSEFSTRLIYKDGKPVGIHAIGHDISERKKYERALRESEERYHSIFDNAQDFVFTIDTSSRLTSITNYFYKVTGYTPAEVINAQIGKILTPESLRTAQEMIAEKVEKGSPVTRYEVDVVAKDGHIIPIELNTSLSYKNGKLVGSVGIGRDITERRAYEQALLENEEKYRGLFENAGDFAYSTDLEGNFSAVSESLLRATGYGRKELLMSSITRILSKENLDLARKMTAAKLAGEKETTRYEMSIIAKDGNEIPIEVVSALVYKDGKPVGVQGIGRDISDRKRAEEALRRSEGNYRELMEQAADSIMVADHDANRYVDVNRAACELLGYTREELLALGPRDLLDPEELKTQPAKFGEIQRGETTFSERHLLRKDGSRVLVEMTAKMLPDGRMMSVKRDIGERRRAEEALRNSERNYRELMEQAADAIFVADPKGLRYVDANQAACDLLGYAREELIGMPFNSIFHPDEIAQEPIKYEEMWRGEIIHTRRRFRRKNGSYVPVELNARMLADGRLQALARDVSEWLSREAELKKANEKAEAASRAKSEFLANMSHEIRTPMNSVIGMARLALLHEHDSGQRGYLEKILLSGEHLLGIIDDILDFSKIDAGKLGIEYVELDVVRVMENVTSIVAEKAKAKGLHYAVDVGSDIPRGLFGDPLRLRQILLNLTDNAIKFTSSGEVKVSVQRLKCDRSDCLIHFEVCDTGIGMSEQSLAGLFNPFQQADGSVTRNYGGTGLGLVISKRLVDLMGGEMGISSKPGKGSTFWFRIPLYKAKGSAKSSSEIDMVDQDSARKLVGGKRVLLVENNLFNQQVARELMENVGLVVLVANNGVEALELLRQDRFDGVLMDLQMPVMDGLEAVAHIRTNPDWDALPVIAMTANALEEERKRCLAAGMNDFIPKPVRPEMLYAVLAKWLSPGKLPETAGTGKAVVAERKEPGDLVDFSALEEFMGGKQDKVRELALKFSQATRADLEKLDKALEQQDAAQVRELGHHIKSPAAMIGAMGFADLCRALENIGDDLDGAHELMRQLWEQLAEIEEQIEKKFR